jgi:hypothetical protein
MIAAAVIAAAVTVIIVPGGARYRDSNCEGAGSRNGKRPLPKTSTHVNPTPCLGCVLI